MDWDFEQAQDGNIALTGEIDLSHGLEFIVAVAFGRSAQSASTQLLQALATPFAQQREKYVSQWQRTRSEIRFERANQGWRAHGAPEPVCFAGA
jgi:glucoamylase